MVDVSGEHRHAQQRGSGPERYEKVRQIGEGTFGVVYMARDLRHHNRIVAIKKVRMGKKEEGVSIPAVREIKLLQELHHPNVISMLDVFASKASNNVNLVFEFAVTDLEGVINDRALVLLPSHIKCMMRMMLKALEYLHASWTLHRDLKPGNVLIGADGQLKITDFGLAKLHADVNQKRLTNMVITRWYRPPELLFGSSNYGAPVDIWSMGCIFAELILRAPYFPGESDMDQLKRIFAARGCADENVWKNCYQLPDFVKFQATVPPPSDETIFPSLSSSGRDLLSAMLELDPNKRSSARQALEHAYFVEEPLPCSAKELLAALRRGKCISRDLPAHIWTDADEASTPLETPAPRTDSAPATAIPSTGPKGMEISNSLGKRKLEFT
ncbi:Cyclin-dependent kinase D-3 [Porphyridium purpureum]|uniref:Cyclin-dependent kinase D-3 n=1 Tax=Porphyridium purpureum TaxID=35688 RepID=A0A5J4YT22_PORPP|nr:Cyclin-dependent kinase D-3 [Porphyridium purpureum]|eukprot:POR9669..scf236_6